MGASEDAGDVIVLKELSSAPASPTVGSRPAHRVVTSDPVDLPSSWRSLEETLVAGGVLQVKLIS